MKKLFALALALLLFALAACGANEAGTASPGAGTEASPAGPEESPRTAVRFQTLTKAAKCETGDLYTYSYPALELNTGSQSGPALSRALNGALTPSEDTLSEVDSAARAAYEALDEAGRLDWMGVGYGFQRRAELMRCDGRVLSLLVSDSSSLGGPHPAGSGFGLSCDFASGELLSAEDIASDPAALAEKVERYVLDSAAENPNASAFYDLAAFAESALGEGRWYFADDGLAVFAAPEEIAPYAVGSVVFVLPYSELDGLLKPEYLPASSPKGGPGALSISAGIEGAALSAVLDEGGVEFSLTASEEVTDICVRRVAMDTDGSFYPQQTVLYLSRLSAGESLGLTAAFMDSPLYSVSWGAGETRLIADSGKDGSLLLLEP